MKTLLIPIYCLATICSPIILLAQNSFISLAGELAVPQSKGITGIAGNGIGASVRLESSWSKHIAGMATVEYLWFAKKNSGPGSSPSTSSFTALPIQIGIKYYTKKKQEILHGLFLSFEAGIMATVTRFDFESYPDRVYKERGLSAAPGIGYLLGRLEPSIRVQFNLMATGYDIYYFNFRLAYVVLRKKNKD